LREEHSVAATIGKIESTKQGHEKTGRIQSVQDQRDERAVLNTPAGKKPQREHPFETGNPNRNQPQSPIRKELVGTEHPDKPWKIQ